MITSFVLKKQFFSSRIAHVCCLLLLFIFEVNSQDDMPHSKLEAISSEIIQSRHDISLLNDNCRFASINNLIVNGNINTLSQWKTDNNATQKADENVLIITGNGSSNTLLVSNLNRFPLNGNHYFLSCDVMIDDSACSMIRLSIAGGYTSTTVVSPVPNKWYRVSCRYIGSHTGEQNAFYITATYPDSSTQLNKTLRIKNAIGFKINEDFGLGIDPPLYKLMDIISLNPYWEGEKNVIIQKIETNRIINNESNHFILPSKNAFHVKHKPVVTFVCDDGWDDDYIKLVAISEKHSVPFTSAIFDGSTLSEWHALYLQNNLGWEFASHPDNSPLAEKSTEAAIEDAIIHTNQYLTNRGLKYYNIVYPYGSHDERVRRIAKKYYRCACTTDPNGLNKNVVASFVLHRFPIGYGGNEKTNNLEYLKRKVDEAATNPSWLIFMLHPHMKEHTDEVTQIIEDLILYIKSLNIDILTLNEGYDIWGNALECGDYIGGEDGIAISFDGQTANLK